MVLAMKKLKLDDWLYIIIQSILLLVITGCNIYMILMLYDLCDIIITVAMLLVIVVPTCVMVFAIFEPFRG